MKRFSIFVALLLIVAMTLTTSVTTAQEPEEEDLAPIPTEEEAESVEDLAPVTEEEDLAPEEATEEEDLAPVTEEEDLAPEEATEEEDLAPVAEEEDLATEEEDLAPVAEEEDLSLEEVTEEEDLAPVPEEESVATDDQVIEDLAVESSSNDLLPLSARTAAWLVAVTYQNVGTGDANVQANFYAEDSGTAISYSPGTLAAGAGTSFGIGKVDNLGDSFLGGGVLTAEEPLVATVIQYSSQSDFMMRMIYNGFSSTKASNQYLIATVLKNTFNRTTVFSIQNTETTSTKVTIQFIDKTDGSVASTKEFTIPGQSVKFIEMDNTADTGISSASFDGSAIITAEGSAKVVAAATEYYTNSNVGANFEGLPLADAGTTIYLATGVCESFGLDTFYAVQNSSTTSGDNAYIEVTYYDADGNKKATDGRYQIGPGQKKSIITCEPNDGTNMSGFSGSAVINSYSTSTGTTEGAPIVAIGKAQQSSTGGTSTELAFTAFLSEKEGHSTVAMPFIRWASDSNFVSTKPGSQRTYIAVQNVSDTEIQVKVTYKDKNGTTVGTPETLTIPPFAKKNSNPSASGAVAAGSSSGMKTGEFGYYSDGTFGAGAIIEGVSTSTNSSPKFIAIVRANNNGASEDYNGPSVD